MKNLEIDDELYQYIASKTEYIGESASAILRRLLAIENTSFQEEKVASTLGVSEEPVTEKIEKTVSEVEINAGSVFDFINKEELATQRGAVGRFLIILGALYRVHQKDFDRVLEIRGRDRLYFAQSEQAILECGSSTKPRQIPDSPYWVITNSNTTRKKMMLTEAASCFGYSEAEVEQIRDLL